MVGDQVLKGMSGSLQYIGPTLMALSRQSMLSLFWIVLSGVGGLSHAAKTGLTSAEVLASAKPQDWRQTDPEQTVYLELPSGRVILELAPAFAPKHVENIRTMVKEGYFDGLSILRSQDNYVVQWGDPLSGADAGSPKSLGEAQAHLPAEFARPAKGLSFTPLKGPDLYAPEAGWVEGFPAGRDLKTGQAWLVHCYGMVGAGRDTPADSSNGAELYAVTGHSPRHLDRNITLVGRVLEGMEVLSSLPRGKGTMGFYGSAEERQPLLSVKLEAAVPVSQRTPVEVLRTDTPLFERWVEARRSRREPWFVHPVGKVDLCNVPLPVRPAAKP